MAGFRSHFVFPNMSVANWFPGHMAKGMQDMTRRLQFCDCVIEVHDARIPFSGRNPNLSKVLGQRPRILALNKMDLASSTCTEEVLRLLAGAGESRTLFTNCKEQHHQSVGELKSMLLEAIDWEHSKKKEAAYKLMVVGMPNVGKSSLINALRRYSIGKGKATKVGALPGVTRAIQTKIKILESPPLYVYDTPGLVDAEAANRSVMMPNIESEEVAMKLAVIGMLRDHLIGERDIADYLLYTLNRHHLFEYTDYYHLTQPCDDIETTLDQIALRLGAFRKGGVPDHDRAAKHFLRQFRNGKLGKITLDCLSSNSSAT